MKAQPRLIFTFMVVIMLISAGLSFTLFRNKEPAEKVIGNSKMNIVSDGFEQISTTAAAIGQTIRLQHQIDSLSAKHQLSPQDSQQLESDLDQLRRLHQAQKP